ncbi:hypothetical protein PTTG_26771 [Puccinia triticina 1-1 BBBD Race 1]|uniref:CCHC-type domain-containing protein n=1 Tax=Puccinia triticina (isolate 1-1 / race 1 (BBBD)) TaxID=630390 RepID=A0A180GRV0_PUCT1|nr:hypothetical protein PTTG_26771 [Puccinia triticina 1-1 BBBD Race 1]
MAPVNRSPSSMATQSSIVAAAASSSNAAGKRVARSPPPTLDDEINTVRAPQEEPCQTGPRINLPDNDAPLPPDFLYALDSRNKDQIIKHAHHLFPEAKKLGPPGSNFRTWLTKMEELADFALDYRNFYFEDFSRHPVDHIARVIFCIAFRAAQINRWRALKSIECDQGVPATTESIFGLMLQDSIVQGSPLRQEFNYRVDQELAARRQIPRLFTKMIDLLNDCQEKVWGREATHRGSVPPLIFEAEAPQAPARNNSIESHPDNVYTLAGRPGKYKQATSQPRNCFRSGSGGHLIGACPVSADTVQKTVPANQQARNHVQTPQYQAYYPILAPPVPGYVFPQFYQPMPTNGNVLRPANVARPVYPQGS